MEHNKYKIAGWLSIICGLLLIPGTILSTNISHIITFGNIPGRNVYFGLNILLVLKTVLGGILFVYLLTVLKNMLTNRYHFAETNSIILTMISIFIIVLILNIFLTLFQMPLYLLWFSVALRALLGITVIILAVKMLKLDDSLKGLLKPFSIVIIVSGLLYSLTCLSFPILFTEDFFHGTRHFITGMIHPFSVSDLLYSQAMGEPGFELKLGIVSFLDKISILVYAASFILLAIIFIRTEEEVEFV